MSERIGSNDVPLPSPNNGQGGNESAGWPPATYSADGAVRQEQEEVSRAEENPEAVLAALETGSETPEQRQQRLGQFVETHFEGEFSADGMKNAVQECTLFENDCRELFEEPDLTLMAEDAADAGLRERIENFATVAANNEAIAATTTERDQAIATREEQETVTIPQNAVTEEAQAAETVALRATDRQETARNSEVNRDLATVEDLDANFQALKAEHGTIGALKLLLDPETGVKAPEMLAKVHRSVATAEALTGAIEGKEAVTERLMNQAGVNLMASSQAEAFASFFDLAESSGEYTEEELGTLRRVVNNHEDVETGSDMKAAFAEGRETVTNPDGTTTTVPYDKDHQMQWADGISAYPDGDTIRGTADIGGRRFPFEAPANISGVALTERLNYSVFSAIKESAGVTGGTNQGFEVTQGTKAMHLGDEVFEGQAVRIAKLGLENMIDRFDAGTTLVDAQAIKQIQWGHQWIMPQVDVAGDGGFSDNSERTRAEALGGRGHDGLIWSADDQLNEANYIVACQFIRDRARTGMAEPQIEDLIAHINKVNGEGPGEENIA